MLSIADALAVIYICN